MQNNATWVVVANSAQAKIYRVVRFPKVEEIASLDHPESRLLNQELVSSAPGRTFQSGGVTRHSYQSKTSPKQVEIEIFARYLADHLCSTCQKGEFKRLYLFASPEFLGLLRPHFDHRLQQTLIAEVPKDVTEYTKAHIEEYLQEL